MMMMKTFLRNGVFRIVFGAAFTTFTRFPVFGCFDVSDKNAWEGLVPDVALEMKKLACISVCVCVLLWVLRWESF